MRGARVAQRLLGASMPWHQGASAALHGAAPATSMALRGMSTDATPPAFADPGASKALKTMLAYPWYPLSSPVVTEAERALKASSDEAAKDALEKTKAAAEAVEAFGEKLENLRMEIDELSGGKFGGETVGNLPEHVKKALLSALKRYTAYLGSFSSEEEWLKKKVENELGASLLLVKQRCSGLESEWNQVSLLGTSGLSGSYIEKRGLKS